MRNGKRNERIIIKCEITAYLSTQTLCPFAVVEEVVKYNAKRITQEERKTKYKRYTYMLKNRKITNIIT